jgi:hypothetical protein
VRPTGENIDERLFGHILRMPCSWVLNQVQHDVMGCA